MGDVSVDSAGRVEGGVEEGSIEGRLPSEGERAQESDRVAAEKRAKKMQQKRDLRARNGKAFKSREKVSISFLRAISRLPPYATAQSG